MISARNSTSAGEAASRMRPAQICVAELARLIGFDHLNEGDLASEFLPTVRLLHRDRHLYNAGDRCETVYVIYSGVFKTYSPADDFSEQILAFPMRGDILGADGIASGTYHHSAVAMDTASVVVLQHADLIHAAHRNRLIAQLMCSLFSKELQRNNERVKLLCNTSAVGRFATFLLDTRTRYSGNGYSATSFHLPMRRDEIANYLGVAGETVSRAIALLVRDGLIDIKGREVALTNINGLMNLAHEPQPATAREVRSRNAARHANSLSLATLASA